jgi:hypothetical protein
MLVIDWLISKKSSPLKLLGQMNRNLVGSIPGRSSIKTISSRFANKHGELPVAPMLVNGSGRNEQSL